MTTTSAARPGYTAPPDPLLDAATVAAASDAELTETIAALLAEQRRRALASGDPAAVADRGFEEGFDRAGKPAAPYLHDGLLVCPGGKTTKSRTSHDCVFVAVGDTWVWEYDDVVFDDMRQVPGGKWLQAVTVIAAVEGLELDMVESKARSGGKCQMVSARSFEVRGGKLVETQVRTRTLPGHR